MSDPTLLGLGLATSAVLLFGVWLIQLITHNAGLVDVVWSASLGVMALEYAVLGSAPQGLRIVMAVLAVGWSGRLAVYLAIRMIGAPEDSRYAALRQKWGTQANLWMLAFFVLQAVIAVVLSLSFWVVATMDVMPPMVCLIAAAIIAAGSVLGEGLADAQLARFKANPANCGWVCARGLWRYSRHPNYFFESLYWVTFIVLAAGASLWWVTLISPVLMAVLLLKISGIPTVETRSAAGKRKGHDAYVATTSAFIPWPPKHGTSSDDTA